MTVTELTKKLLKSLGISLHTTLMNFQTLVLLSSSFKWRSIFVHVSPPIDIRIAICKGKFWTVHSLILASVDVSMQLYTHVCCVWCLSWNCTYTYTCINMYMYMYTHTCIYKLQYLANIDHIRNQSKTFQLQLRDICL